MSHIPPLGRSNMATKQPQVILVELLLPLLRSPVEESNFVTRQRGTLKMGLLWLPEVILMSTPRLAWKHAKNIKITWFSPPARWGLLDFMSDARLLLLSPSFSFLLLPSPSFLFPSPSFSFLLPSPRRTSSASSWSQWASPDLICQLLIAVGLAGPHLPALDRSGPHRASTASSRSQWASPDLNRRESERCGPRRTPTGEIQIRSAVGPAGLQPARFGALWASPDLNRRESESCGPRRTSTRPQRPETKPYRMPKRMPDRMSEDMPDRMSEDIPDWMSEDLPHRMLD